jgi:outer membrane scaffolding protein for murein synthesis (MipA/OmpV family)
MHKFLVLAIAGACGTVAAQTPATNPMPDGSRDMYVGLGVQSMPRYDGARHNKTVALPVLQVQWSNGMFVSGLSAGMHLSSLPSVEYGPLIALALRRDEDGMGGGIGGVGDGAGNGGVGTSTILPGGIAEPFSKSGNRLAGMDVIETRLLYGGFFNYYLTPQLRLSNNLLYGAGNGRDGLRWHTALQYLLPNAAPHHSLVLSAGVSVVNRAYNNAYFGVSRMENERNRIGAYHAGGGVQDVRLGVRWNWALNPAWMLTSGLQVNRLLGDAKDSPLVERPNNVTVSTALAYRF